MNLAKKHFLVIISVCLVLIFITYGFLDMNKNKTEEMIPNNSSSKNQIVVIKETPDFLTKEALKGTLYVSVIGDMKFPVENPSIDNDKETGNGFIHFTYVPSNQFKKINKNSRFIIVNEEVLSEKENTPLMNQIHKWMKEKRTVLLYSKNLTNETVQSVFGNEYKLYTFESSFEMKYPLYGLGYSPNEEQVIPIFLVINSEEKELNSDIVDFLLRKQAF